MRVFRKAWVVLAATTMISSATLGIGPLAAQDRPADLTELPPVPTDYTPEKTEWGDWDFRGTWPIENLPAARILFQRPLPYGDRVWVTDEELEKRIENAQASDGNFTQANDQGIGAGGTQGLAAWVRNSSFGKRTSMLVDPPDGQLPALTPEGERLYEAGRSGWVPGQHYDWMDDFDSWDRCISRGFPASMYPFRYNNGIRVFQSPGYFIIDLEMLGTRIIPIGDAPPVPGAVEQWLGLSRGHWEGKTLVIETTNIVSGDSVAEDVSKRSSSPLNMATQHVPPFNTIPMSKQAKTVERLTMTGPNTIVHELTYSDPVYWTAPWTTRIEWTRNDDYEFFEYACHEGNRMPRDYIMASRAQREAIARGEKEEETGVEDTRNRFAQKFDFDPAVEQSPFGPPPPPPADDADEGESAE